MEIGLIAALSPGGQRHGVRDLIMQMRVASYFGKVMSHNLMAASRTDVCEAATLGGARAQRLIPRSLTLGAR